VIGAPYSYVVWMESFLDADNMGFDVFCPVGDHTLLPLRNDTCLPLCTGALYDRLGNFNDTSDMRLDTGHVGGNIGMSERVPDRLDDEWIKDYSSVLKGTTTKKILWVGRTNSKKVGGEEQEECKGDGIKEAEESFFVRFTPQRFPRF
jgi:hypothetical protein